MTDTAKPRVLVLGGCGFVGRNLVKHLVDQDLCSAIVVADKTMPMIACFAPPFTASAHLPDASS